MIVSDKLFMDVDKTEQKERQFYKTLKSTKECDQYCKNSLLNTDKFLKKQAKRHGYTYKKIVNQWMIYSIVGVGNRLAMRHVMDICLGIKRESRNFTLRLKMDFTKNTQRKILKR